MSPVTATRWVPADRVTCRVDRQTPSVRRSTTTVRAAGCAGSRSPTRSQGTVGPWSPSAGESRDADRVRECGSALGGGGQDARISPIERGRSVAAEPTRCPPRPSSTRCLCGVVAAVVGPRSRGDRHPSMRASLGSWASATVATHRGVAAAAGDDSGPAVVPATAWTVKSYSVPLVSGDTVRDVAEGPGASGTAGHHISRDGIGALGSRGPGNGGRTSPRGLPGLRWARRVGG